MKKVFSLNVDNKKPERQVDSIKHEIKKYVQRERRKDLPTGSDFWDFNCKIGAIQQNAEVVHLKELNTKIDDLVKEGKEDFYIEVVAEAKTRQKKQG